jgi:hypothetical protein
MDAITHRPRQRADRTLRFISKHDLWNQVALQCGITPEAVRAWRRVPAGQVRNVERATGRPAYMIRPDLHDRPLIQHQ